MIASPNGGTVLADVPCGIVNMPGGVIEREIAKRATRAVLDQWFGQCEDLGDSAVWQLTEAHVRNNLNRRVHDNPEVIYQTIAGASSCGPCRLLGPIMGDNDGLVSGRERREAGRARTRQLRGVQPQHGELFVRQSVADRVSCSLTQRGQDDEPCDVEPPAATDTSAVAAAALPTDGPYHLVDLFPGDFDVVPGTLTFRPGETSKTIALTINGDTLDEADENALIGLTSPTNATVGGFGVAGVTITDDDP